MVKVLNQFTRNYQHIADETMPAVRKFCNRHGYRHIERVTSDGAGEFIVWDRLRLYLEVYEPQDTIVWMDADVLIVNPDFDLTPHFPDKSGVSFSKDLNGLCCGFFIGQGEWAANLIRTALFLGTSDFDPAFNEQGTIKAMVQHWPSVNKHINYIPEAVVANQATPFTENPFAIHFWGNGWRHPGCRDALPGDIRLVRTQGWTPEIRKQVFPWFP